MDSLKAGWKEKPIFEKKSKNKDKDKKKKKKSKK